MFNLDHHECYKWHIGDSYDSLEQLERCMNAAYREKKPINRWDRLSRRGVYWKMHNIKRDLLRLQSTIQNHLNR